MLPVDVLYTTRRKIEGGVGALRESDDTNFLKPNGRSRNFNIYDIEPSFYVKLLIHKHVETFLVV